MGQNIIIIKIFYSVKEKGKRELTGIFTLRKINIYECKRNLVQNNELQRKNCAILTLYL